jgi:membrane-bound lytic murein transglycosylase
MMPTVRRIRTALEQVCARAVKAGRLEPAAARQFFETNFVPVRIRKLGDPAGFLTGYYEPIVDGSRFPTRELSSRSSGIRALPRRGGGRDGDWTIRPEN